MNRAIILCLLSSLSLTSLASCTYNPARSIKAHLKPNSYLYADNCFVAMQYFGGILNRRVKVFVLEDMLRVATVGGPLATPLFATENWYDPKFYIDPTLAQRYKNLDPRSNLFLSIDNTNYEIKRSLITRIEYDATDKWGMGVVPHSGKILVQTLDGSEHEFILLGSQDGTFVKSMIEQTMQGKR